MNFLDACRAFIGVDSSPDGGTRAAAEFVGDLARRAGLDVELSAEVLGEVEECNLIVRPGPTRPTNELLLQTHLDTAAPGHFGRWTKTESNPFKASIYGDVLYGLGAADAKLDLLCKLEAARAFAGRADAPFALVGTFGGQRGMTGAVRLIRQKKVRARWALVGEPTELKLVHAGAGVATVEVAIPFAADERDYRRAHDRLETASSQGRVFYGGPDADALRHVFEHLDRLPGGIALMDLEAGPDLRAAPTQAVLEIDTATGLKDPVVPKLGRIHRALVAIARRMAEYREVDFEPEHPTVHPSLVRTNDVGVTITLLCRLPPGVTDAIWDGWMNDLARACATNGATFHVSEFRGGFKTAPDGALSSGAREILAAMGLDADLRKQAVTSEANVFSRLGIECLAFGPGRGAGNAHRANENVSIEALRVAVEFYRRVIARFARPDPA